YPYALTKRLGEEIVLHWAKVYNIPAISTRFFNVYGTRSRTSGTYGAVFGVFLAQRLANEPLTIIGDGNQKRDFSYVTDICKGMMLAAESKYTNEIFNIGSGKPQSINRLAELIGGETVYIPERPGEPTITHANIEKAKSLLNYNPEVEFELGVKKVIDNINYWANAPVWTPEKIEEVSKPWFDSLGAKI
ncbi:NAD-dependent epimerase/dehydratase family protein, partial [Synechococcus sp. AH-551-E05]